MSRKNLKVLILIGLPGSGKSTFAKEHLAKNPNWTRVNRDDFRGMLQNQQICEPKIEAMINELQDFTIIQALKAKQNVIIDNTNLKTKYIEHFCQLVQGQAEVDFLLINTSIKKCVERDKERANPVGEVVIQRMHKDLEILLDAHDFSHRPVKPKIYTNPTPDPQLPNCYVFDIDGTLAHMNGHRGPFDWSKVDRDDYDLSVVATLRKLSQTDKIILLSGRDEEAREKTLEWLEFYAIPFDALYMRPKGDFRKDTIIKKELYNQHLKGKFNVIAVFDDRTSVVQMWRKLGLKCFEVEHHDF